MEENTIFIDGVLYKKIHSLNCRGCAFDGGPKQCFQPNLNCAKEEGGIIYKACKTAEYDKMWIDLSWVHGETREVISKKIHEIAFSKGYNIKSDIPFIHSSSYLVLAYGILNHTSNKNVIDFLKGYSEISVNEALKGNFLRAKDDSKTTVEIKEKPELKEGDVVCNGMMKIMNKEDFLKLGEIYDEAVKKEEKVSSTMESLFDKDTTVMFYQFSSLVYKALKIVLSQDYDLSDGENDDGWLSYFVYEAKGNDMKVVTGEHVYFLNTWEDFYSFLECEQKKKVNT